MGMALLAGCLAVSLSSGQGKPEGYLAEPKSGRGAGVLVLHPWWGLNSGVKAVCDRLAGAGFFAFAPDLFHGKTAATREEAEALVKGFSDKEAEVKAQIVEAGRFLAKRTERAQIGVVGLSFGAYYALAFSNDEPELVRSVVVFYGTGPEDFAKSKAAYLGHFAEKDEFEPKPGVDKLAKLLKDAGRKATFFSYPGVGHWFFEPSVAGAYDKKSAELAWGRTVRFLEDTLR